MRRPASVNSQYSCLRLHARTSRDRIGPPHDRRAMAVPMDPVSAAFMFADSRSTPMHVGGLQLFRLPEGAGPEWVRAEYERSLDVPEVAPIYSKRPYRSAKTAGQYFWRQDI